MLIVDTHCGSAFLGMYKVLVPVLFMEQFVWLIFFKTNQMTKYTKICLGESFEYIILADHEQVSGSWFPCLSVKIEVSFLLKYKAVQSSG